MTPRLYIERIGPLHSIRRAGKRPLLAAYVTAAPGAGRRATVGQLRTGARNARRGQAAAAFGGRVQGRSVKVVSLPMFVGVPSVRIRKRFALAAVFDRARKGLGASYLKHLKAEG